MYMPGRSGICRGGREYAGKGEKYAGKGEKYAGEGEKYAGAFGATN